MFSWTYLRVPFSWSYLLKGPFFCAPSYLYGYVSTAWTSGALGDTITEENSDKKVLKLFRTSFIHQKFMKIFWYGLIDTCSMQLSKY